MVERDELKKAIERWWQGGGTAVLLINVLEREDASVFEAKAVAKECGVIADKGYRVNEDVIIRVLGDLRSSINRNGQREERTVKRTFDPSLCLFVDAIECPNCGEVHGHLLTQAEFAPRFDEVRELLSAWVDEGIASQTRPWLTPHRDRSKQYMRDAGSDFMVRQAEKLRKK